MEFLYLTPEYLFKGIFSFPSKIWGFFCLIYGSLLVAFFSPMLQIITQAKKEKEKKKAIYKYTLILGYSQNSVSPV